MYWYTQKTLLLLLNLRGIIQTVANTKRSYLKRRTNIIGSNLLFYWLGLRVYFGVYKIRVNPNKVSFN